MTYIAPFLHFTISATKPYRYGIPDASYFFLSRRITASGGYGGSRGVEPRVTEPCLRASRRHNSVARNVGYSCVTCQLRLIKSLLSTFCFRKKSPEVWAASFWLVHFNCFQLATCGLSPTSSALVESRYLRSHIHSTISSIILTWFYSIIVL